MRLKKDEQSSLSLAQRSERRPDLSRVVRVVVDYLDADRGPARLEPTARPEERSESTLRYAAFDAGALEGGQRDCRVAPVVIPAHGELALVGLERVAANL